MVSVPRVMNLVSDRRTLSFFATRPLDGFCQRPGNSLSLVCRDLSFGLSLRFEVSLRAQAPGLSASDDCTAGADRYAGNLSAAASPGREAHAHQNSEDR